MAIRIPSDPTLPDLEGTAERSDITRRPIPVRSGITRRPIPIRAGAVGPEAAAPTSALSAPVHLAVVPGEDLVALISEPSGLAENGLVTAGSTEALLLIVLGEEPAAENGVVALDYLDADDAILDETTVLAEPLRELSYTAGARVVLGVLREKPGLTETRRVRVRAHDNPDAEAVFEVGP